MLVYIITCDVYYVYHMDSKLLTFTMITLHYMFYDHILGDPEYDLISGLQLVT